MIAENKKVIQKLILGGVVVRDSKALILQRHQHENVYPNLWELPSGTRETLEPSETSLLREVKEETGLEVKIIVPLSVFDYQIERPDEIRDSTQINFLVIPTNNADVVLSDEHQAFAWITYKQADQYNMTEATKIVLQKAFKIINKSGPEIF